MKKYSIPNVVDFENVDVLVDFLERNAKNECNVEVVLNEVYEKSAMGGVYYELKGFETKDGNPASISFEYTYDYDEELDEVTNAVISF